MPVWLVSASVKTWLQMAKLPLRVAFVHPDLGIGGAEPCVLPP